MRILLVEDDELVHSSVKQAFQDVLTSIFSRDNLEESLYVWNQEVASNAIEFIIHSLRKKLGKDTFKNVRGMGRMVIK